MPLACIFTRTWLGPGWGWGTSLICQELLLAGTTAACIFVSSMAIRCANLKMWHVIFCGHFFFCSCLHEIVQGLHADFRKPPTPAAAWLTLGTTRRNLNSGASLWISLKKS